MLRNSVSKNDQLLRMLCDRLGCIKMKIPLFWIVLSFAVIFHTRRVINVSLVILLFQHRVVC